MTGFNSKREAAADKLQEPVVDKGFPWTQKHVATPQVFGAMPSNIPPPQPAQEPAATVTSESGNPNVTMSWWHEPALPVGTKLYTAPPQREWVGLTDEDKAELAKAQHSWEDLCLAVEAKLKARNHGT